MTAPAPSGGQSPLRIGALALLGVGAVAAIIGVGTLVTAGGTDGATVAAPTPTSVTAPVSPAPVSPTAVVPPSAEVPVPPFGPTPTTTIAGPTAPPVAAEAAAGGSGGSAGSGASVVKSPVRVYNNSTIKGLAARAADDFRAAGWSVTAVASYPYGIIPTSTVYYRPGTAEQPGAQALADEFGLRAEARFVGLDDASPGLIVIVTNDYQKRG
jgi:hypothetical protein